MGMNEFAVFEYAEKSCWFRKPICNEFSADCYEKGFTQVEALLEKAYRACFNV